MNSSVRTALPRQSDVSRLSSRSNSSLARRTCRICQSETGVMLRPCNCAGTMGDIHENCLSTWVTMSNKTNCEICKETYQRSDEKYKKIRDWNRPKLEHKDYTTIAMIFGLGFSIGYILLLFVERKFYERCFDRNLPVRSDDFGRVFILVIMTCLFLMTLITAFSDARGYLKKQKEIRFINRRP